MSICENGQKARWRAMRTSYPPFTARSTLPSTGRPARNASSSCRVGRGAARQPPGERQPSLGRHHHRLDAVADGDLERAVVVLQFVDLDRGLALAADVDERHLRADRDDRALDGLALLEALRLERRLEHRGEIFIGLAHGALLVVGRWIIRANRLQGVILNDGRPVTICSASCELRSMTTKRPCPRSEAAGSGRTGMWYIFPQFDGLGSDPTSKQYAVKSVAEARAFLAHPLLGPRLRECAAAAVRRIRKPFRRGHLRLSGRHEAAILRDAVRLGVSRRFGLSSRHRQVL